MSEQYHEKKQLQFGSDTKELAVLANYPFNFNRQNTNDNQLYQAVDPNFLANYQIPREKADVKKFIGEGAFGNVYEGVYKHDDVAERVAIKVISLVLPDFRIRSRLQANLFLYSPQRF